MEAPCSYTLVLLIPYLTLREEINKLLYSQISDVPQVIDEDEDHLPVEDSAAVEVLYISFLLSIL